ncbi:MAG: universal stress protein [Planctomycetes bacterium]|nr:universal stress protein [Planctomycetota bacterium]
MRILAGIDAYPESESTFRAAVEVALALEAKPFFVHAVPMARHSAYAALDSGDSREVALQKIEGELQRRLEGWCAESPWAGREVNLDVLDGRPAKVIVRQAHEHGVDWLVIGQHKKHGYLDFGNTMRQAFAATELPIWMQVGAWKHPKTILAPVDLSPASEIVLAQARDLARAFQAKLIVLHCCSTPFFATTYSGAPPAVMPNYVVESIHEEDRQAFETLVSTFDWQGVEHESRFEDAEAVECIREHTGEVDLLVMGQHGHGWISSTVLGSTAYAVLKDSKCSVLALRQLG